jgi:hypothetical protein
MGKYSFIEIIEIGFQKAFFSHFIDEVITAGLLKEDHETNAPSSQGDAHSATGGKFCCVECR